MMKNKLDAYKTFAIRQPTGTHRRPASCSEINCEAHINGWSLRKADLTPELLYVATHSGRRFRTDNLNGEIYLVFESGQICFDYRKHTISLERPAFFYAGRGARQAFSTRRATQYSTAENWAEDFSIHLDRIQSEINKG